ARHRSQLIITVGSEAQPLKVHRDLICFYSHFFRAALRSPFKKSLDGKVHLPDDPVEVLELFMRWLYTQKLTNGECEPRNLSRTLLFDLYVFADKCDIPQLQNKVVDLVMEKSGAGIIGKEITRI
ncbi:MAG: hypothetical protein M1830_003106, partial [Pleopsidium flavum]